MKKIVDQHLLLGSGCSHTNYIITVRNSSVALVYNNHVGKSRSHKVVANGKAGPFLYW